MDNIDNNLPQKVLVGLDGAIDTRVDVRVKPVEEKMATMVKDIQTLKDLLQARDNNEVANSNANDEVNSNDMVR